MNGDKSNRSRVIKDIESLDQAIKAEKDVESGYHGTIEENINYWMAVEEDIVESYTKLVGQVSNQEVKRILTLIIEDSVKHGRMLGQISGMLKEIMKDEDKHARLLETARAVLEKTSK